VQDGHTAGELRRSAVGREFRVRSEGDFQHFLARESYFSQFPPVSCPYLVEYLFIQSFDYFQNLINHRIGTLLFHDLF
jgi:hypothetical protein